MRPAAGTRAGWGAGGPRLAGCALVLATLAGATLAGAAQAHRAILPAPREISYGTGYLDLRGIGIRIDAGPGVAPDAADRFAARTLGGCLGMSDARGGGRTRSILLRRTASSDPLPAPGEGVGAGSREAYRVRVGPAGAEITARSSAGIYYGVQTVCQMAEGARLPEASIRDWPRFAYRGTLADISEGQMPHVAELEREIDLMARLKMNQLYLYNELSIALAGLAPAAPGARMSRADVRRLVAYARERHIDVVPALELYGHQHDLFRREEYSALADFPHGVEFNPSDARVQALLARWAGQYMDLFPGPFVHVGFDETWQLRQAAREGRAEPESYFLSQLGEVSRLFTSRGRTVLAWADMMVKFPEILARLPPGIIAVTWSYDPGQDPDYHQGIDPLAGRRQPFLVAPGVHGWVEIAPDYALTFDNIDTLLAAGERRGALGMMNTVWSDDLQMLKRPALPGVAYGAAASWQQAAVDRGRFFADYAALVYPPAARAEMADALAQLARGESALERVLGQETMNVLWQNPFRGRWLEAARAGAGQLVECRLAAERAERDIVAASRHGVPPDSLRSWLVEARLMDYAGMRFQYAVEITDAWRALGPRPDPERLENDFENIVVSPQHGRIADLMEAITELRPQYRAAWLDEFTTFRMGEALGRWDAEYELWRRLQAGLAHALGEYDRDRGLPGFETLVPVD